MKYDEWMLMTKGGPSQWRPASLKRVDAALKLYESTPTRPNAKSLAEAVTTLGNLPKPAANVVSVPPGTLKELDLWVKGKLGLNIKTSAANFAAYTQRTLATEHLISVPVSQTIDYGATQQKFDWTVSLGFVHLGTAVQVNCRILTKFGNTTISEADRSAWKTHIESAWNIARLDDGVRRYDLLFNLIWVGDKSVPCYEVFTHHPPANAAKMSRDELAAYLDSATLDLKTWGVSDRIAIIHEFGHMIGNPDEYSCIKIKGMGQTYNAATHNQPAYTTNSIMNNVKAREARIFPRHFSFVAEQYSLWKKLTPPARIVIEKPQVTSVTMQKLISRSDFDAHEAQTNASYLSAKAAKKSP